MDNFGKSWRRLHVSEIVARGINGRLSVLCSLISIIARDDDFHVNTDKHEDFRNLGRTSAMQTSTIVNLLTKQASKFNSYLNMVRIGLLHIRSERD